MASMRANRNRFADLDQEVSSTLRAELGRHRVSQTSIASALGMHPNVLGRKIRGEVSLSAGELGGIAGALGTTGAEIMRRAEAATSPVLAVSSGGVPSPQEVLDHEVACGECGSLDEAAAHLASLTGPGEDAPAGGDAPTAPVGDASPALAGPSVREAA